MNINVLQLLGIATGAWLSKSLSFRLGNYTISATENGAPVHFTFALAFKAASMVLAGQTGSFQVGSVLVSIKEGV